ncbi:hypothetical protein [Flavobacterium sp.]|uniref:hypothetical protein n=1 Tax=Flavobacterium sp. TaxID=239 RepID=UPI0040331C49
MAMLKKYLTLLLLATLCSNAQEITQKQAEEAFKNADFVAELTYTEGDPLYDALAKAKKGEVVVVDSELYKIIGYDSVLTVRYGSLYLDAEAYSPKEIKKAKEASIKAYNEGTPFEIILEQYHPGEAKEMANFEMSPEYIIPEIAAALKAHKAGDIFSVTVGSDAYVIVKKSEPYSKKAVQVLYMMYE